MFTIIAERFNSSQEIHEISYVGPAVTKAAELSKVHDMDWVVVLSDGLPILRFVDGESVKI